jgi:hypothetical protein
VGDRSFGDVVGGLLAYVLAHPASSILVAVAVAVSVAEKWRGRGPQDPVRRFSRADKAQLLARAGHQCEQHGIFGRCVQRTGLEADHVHPHSRGGWTAIENGQALCRRHNKLKRAWVPTNRELRRLAARRATYFPEGTPTQVVRRRPRAGQSSEGSVGPAPVTPVRGARPRRPAIPEVGGRHGAAPAQVRRFDPPRAVEVDLDGAWHPAVQTAWRRDGELGWVADVSWHDGYGPDRGRHEAVLPAARLRLPAS